MNDTVDLSSMEMEQAEEFDVSEAVVISHQNPEPDSELVEEEVVETLDPTDTVEVAAYTPVDEVESTPARAQSEDVVDTVEEVEEDKGLVLSLLLLAPKGDMFRGTQLKMALKESGLSHGKMEIFHLLDGDEALVSVANVLEPGTFNLEEMIPLKTPGVVIFSQLPSSKSGAEIFKAWHSAARNLNIALGGRLCSINRMPLEDDYFDKLQEQAEQFAAGGQELAE